MDDHKINNIDQEQDDIVNSPNYEDIAVVELQLCISLTVTECDIDSVTGEIV